MAIDLGTTVEVQLEGEVVRLRSDHQPEEAVVPLDIEEPRCVEPPWARYVAGVVAELRPTIGARGTVTTDLPIGAGLSSSSSLQVALARALGFDGDAPSVAKLCQRAEQRAAGVPCGIMDQLAIAAGVDGALLFIDCESLEVLVEYLPEDLAVVGVHSGVQRDLRTTPYTTRRAECAAVEREIGPLRHASLETVKSISDPVARRRARHVVTENARVVAFVQALRQARYVDAGELMTKNNSLRDDFAVSTPVVDNLVAQLQATPGVFGARMTGGGFGGIVVALCDAGADVQASVGGTRFRPSTGVTVEVTSG